MKQISQETSTLAVDALVKSFDAIQVEFDEGLNKPDFGEAAGCASRQLAIREAVREIVRQYPTTRMAIPFGHYLRSVV